MTYKTYTSILAMMMAATPALAQLNNTVEVTNEVKPVVNDVKKVEIKTQPIKTEVKHYTMNYSTQGETLTNFAPEPLGDYHSEEKDKGNKNGYLHLGGGSHGNADGRFTYLFDITPDDALNIDLSLRGFNGETDKDERLGDAKWKSRFYHSTYGMKYNHSLGNGTNFYVKGGMGNDVFNYRIMPNFNYIGNGNTGIGNTGNGNGNIGYGNIGYGNINGTESNIPSFTTDKQHNITANARIGIESWKTGDFSLDAEAQWLMFRQNRATSFTKGLGENQLSININSDFALADNQSIGLEVIGDHVTYRNGELKNHSCITFLPHYHLATDEIRLKLGLFATSEGSVAPDITVNYLLNDNHEVYVEARGYEVGNDLFYLSSINPYFAVSKPADFDGKMEIEDEFHQINAKIGYRFQKDGFGANIYGGYDMSEAHMDIIQHTLQPGERMFPMVDFKKNKCIYFGADINFAYKDLIKVEGRNRLNIESFRQEQGWTEGSFFSPAFTMDWRADFQLVKDLYLGLDWNLNCYSLPELEDSYAKHLDRKNTLNLGADLRYTLPVELPLTIFVKGDNLLFQKYDRYYGYQNIGASVLAGFAISL